MLDICELAFFSDSRLMASSATVGFSSVMSSTTTDLEVHGSSGSSFTLVESFVVHDRLSVSCDSFLTESSFFEDVDEPDEEAIRGRPPKISNRC